MRLVSRQLCRSEVYRLKGGNLISSGQLYIYEKLDKFLLSSRSPYDMLEQEELLYNENYPGKLCALCNLSERSTLGQGDIIKLKISIELDKKSIEKRSKTSSDATESDLSKER